eukprot:4138521-Prymnesium_polylepis.1
MYPGDRHPMRASARSHLYSCIAPPWVCLAERKASAEVEKQNWPRRPSPRSSSPPTNSTPLLPLTADREHITSLGRHSWDRRAILISQASRHSAIYGLGARRK